MIFHPRFARLTRFATRDSATAHRTHTAAHVSRCPSCGAAVAWVRDARATLRAAAGPNAPGGAWQRIQSRLEAGDVVLLPAADVRGRDARRRGTRSRRIAVAASLMLTAGAAAAVVPGPTRDWLDRSIAMIAGSRRAGSEPEDGASVTGAARRTTLIVPAANGGVTVDIEEADPALEVRIRPTDGPELEVEVSGSAAGARFHSGRGRLTITEAGAGEIVVLLPYALDRATIGVDGTPYVIKRGDEVRVLAPLADTTGSEIVLRPARAPTETER